MRFADAWHATNGVSIMFSSFCPSGARSIPERGEKLIPRLGAQKPQERSSWPAQDRPAASSPRSRHSEATQVKLYDKDSDFGGQVRWFAAATRKPEFLNIFRYYAAMFDKWGVEVHKDVEVTPELVTQEQPDLVVVATGAVPFRPHLREWTSRLCGTGMGRS